MGKTIEILWIEEETNEALSERRAYLGASLDYHFEIAETYTEAIEAIKKYKKFDIIIVDIRIPLGFLGEYPIDPRFERYGLKIIEELYKQKATSKVMIYTNESWRDIQGELLTLGIENRAFLQKKDCRSNEMFESKILEIINL
jgi:DNA-binding NarL/FixJ family response regulator